MYDIIGDIHGYAEELKTLLETLGYSKARSGYHHPDRTAVFCGDFIDRGPEIPEVVRIVRQMCDEGNAVAVMGNHEFNALAFQAEDPDQPGKFLRPHSDRNLKQHAATLNQFSTTELQSALGWFRTLPVSIETDSFRVVHACWNSDCIDQIQAALRNYGNFTAPFLKKATTVHDEIFDAIECVLKGPELPLPDGLFVTDKEGNRRKRIRIRWFHSPQNQTWQTYALPMVNTLPADAVPADAFAAPYASDERPVFVGHYWLRSYPPEPLTNNIACLDYSIAKDGWLCAYRFERELPLAADRFVAIPSRHQAQKHSLGES
ncbi:MAG: metallophosphoesterase [Fuerstiella sp.]